MCSNRLSLLRIIRATYQRSKTLPSSFAQEHAASSHRCKRFRGSGPMDHLVSGSSETACRISFGRALSLRIEPLVVSMAGQQASSGFAYRRTNERCRSYSEAPTCGRRPLASERARWCSTSACGTTSIRTELRVQVATSWGLTAAWLI